MKSNIYLDEDCLQKDPNIGNKLEDLIERMSKELSGPAMSFYQREFDFFDKVTQISGKIRYDRFIGKVRFRMIPYFGECL